MMNLKTLSPAQLGMLKGSITTAMLSTAGIGIGWFFLHRKHEVELDKLEKETAMTCLDFAAEHYEAVIRRRDRITADKNVSTIQPISKTPYHEEFLEFQRTLDNAGKCEPTKETWAELEEKMLLQQKGQEELFQEIGVQKAQADIGIDRLKLKLLAQKAAELAEKADCSEIQMPNIDSEEFQREIDAMNNFEDSKE